MKSFFSFRVNLKWRLRLKPAQERQSHRSRGPQDRDKAEEDTEDRVKGLAAADKDKEARGRRDKVVVVDKGKVVVKDRVVKDHRVKGPEGEIMRGLIMLPLKEDKSRIRVSRKINPGTGMKARLKDRDHRVLRPGTSKN